MLLLFAAVLVLVVIAYIFGLRATASERDRDNKEAELVKCSRIVAEQERQLASLRHKLADAEQVITDGQRRFAAYDGLLHESDEKIAALQEELRASEVLCVQLQQQLARAHRANRHAPLSKHMGQAMAMVSLSDDANSNTSTVEVLTSPSQLSKVYQACSAGQPLLPRSAQLALVTQQR
ncbi:hypothetical protein QJQ45_022893 [Haematococcus lacustris]|nr:hypothetical protein QJQ45_022893 [Haematococcus lacustris]